MTSWADKSQRFTVRVYVGGTAPVVLPGGADHLGFYIEDAAGLRTTLAHDLVRRLPLGESAEFEYRGPFPPDRL